MKDFSALLSHIRSALPELSILENEPLSRHCSFRIGGPCAALLQPSSEAELLSLCRLLREAGELPLLMGNGTNLLIDDAPLPRLVLRLGERFAAAERRGETELWAESGITLARLASLAAAGGLSGLEFAHGIPGSLGGAVYMNAGAYGGEMKDVLLRARWLDEELGLHESGELGLSYRRSRFTGGRDLILGAALRLEPGEEESIRERMRALMERRRQSQPLELPSAGSTFKRPAGGYAAALIEEAGLKGFAVGGAAVSEKHAGFVVNRGGASFSDVLQLMEEIQKRVLARSGIALEPEVRIIRAGED